MNSDASVRSWLEKAGRISRISSAILGVMWWLVVGLGCWLLLFILDNILNFPAAIRFPLALAGGALLLVGFVRRVAIPLFRRDSAERTAVAMERSQNIRENLLINACQLEARTLAGTEQVFAGRTIADSMSAMGSIKPAVIWRAGMLVKWCSAAVLVAGVWLLYGSFFPRQTFNAFSRYVLPLGDVPPAGSVAIGVTPASDLAIGEGADLAVTVAVKPVGRTADTAGSIVPVLVWSEGRKAVAPVRSAGEAAVLSEDPQAPGHYSYTFRSVQRSFSFRILAGDTYSRSVQVSVLARPRVKTSSFVVQPPRYTGLQKQELSGPPASITCLPDSLLEVTVEFDQPASGVTWKRGRTETAFSRAGRGWIARMSVTNAGPYEIAVAGAPGAAPVTAAAGEVGLDADRAPEIDFVAANRNFFAVPGTELPLEIKASDDYGVRRISVVCRDEGDVGLQTGPLAGLKQWDYIGPPGKQGEISERFSTRVDAKSFLPGRAYVLEALCWDYKPDSKPSRSRPVILRVKSVNEMTIPLNDVLARAFDLLKRAVAEQKKANEFTDNLRTHLAEVLSGKALAAHRDGMKRQQLSAQSYGQDAIKELAKHPAEGKLMQDRLTVLVEHEMDWVLASLGKLSAENPGALPGTLSRTADRQEYVYNELLALLGAMFNERRDPAKNAQAAKASKEPLTPPVVTDKGRELADDLAEFVRAQKQIIKRTESIMDKGPQDLTTDKDEVLGELARAEAQWAKFLDEKLTDFSKLPQQDFADGTLAKQLNEVFQDVDKAAAEMYEKKIELAVPLEQSGLEKAETLENNIEKWLADTPDNKKWMMEEPSKPSDVPMAELPAELEDMVGDLLDKEEEMQKDIEDVSSSWLDSMDKGVGWGTGDGPISDMSAKGVTGNVLPNNMEVSGRSGEGRSGKSTGQMVQDTAEGKEGRHTPTRVSPSPFESGSVKDSAKNDNGGATGGGKLSGATEQGLHGPTPPPAPEKMARLSGEQAKIRQEAETLALKLRKYKLPSGDLEASIQAMSRLEAAAKKQDGLAVRRSYNSAIDGLEEARKVVKMESGLHREKSHLPESAQRELMNGMQDSTPKGYEDVVADYFRQMAGSGK